MANVVARGSRGRRDRLVGDAMTAQEWVAAAQLGWREFYPLVEAEAKVWLTQAHVDEPGTDVSTTELVEALWPSAWQSDGKARQRVFKALTALETRGLAGWVTLRQARGRYGMVNYRRWHYPTEGTETQ